MPKFQCLLFVLRRSYNCYYIICLAVPLNLLKEPISVMQHGRGHKCNDSPFKNYFATIILKRITNLNNFPVFQKYPRLSLRSKNVC